MIKANRVTAYDWLKNQYLSLSQTAEVLGKSVRTIQRLCDGGELVRKYDNRTPRICAFSVQAYMNQYSGRPVC